MKTAPTCSGVAPFDRRVYADATSAGLSTLIPLPLVDLLIESVFRRRMPRAICRARGFEADPAALRALGRQKPWFTTRSCLLFPIAFVIYIVKRLSRKIFYVLTIHEAAKSLSSYWHRAYLIDHLVRAGHLASARNIDVVLYSFDRTLALANTASLGRIDRQIIYCARHALRPLRRIFRRGTDITPPTAFLGDHWNTIASHLAKVAEQYDQIYSATVVSSTGATPAVNEPPLERPSDSDCRENEC
ncbi:MAG: hypothetical protein JXO72_15510 [Vicinamibacteria bacterium]|nr:hypothetical protein [Vicinamibacteria bacterium]